MLIIARISSIKLLAIALISSIAVFLIINLCTHISGRAFTRMQADRGRRTRTFNEIKDRIFKTTDMHFALYYVNTILLVGMNIIWCWKMIGFAIQFGFIWTKYNHNQIYVYTMIK